MNSLFRIGGSCACIVLAAVRVCSALAMPQLPPASPSATHRIVVLGDSLAVTPTRAASFPALLQARMSREGRPWTVVNAGVSGDTTAGGLRRLESALQDGADVLVLELGANDGLRGVDIAVVEKNLSTIIEAAQAGGISVLLCGMETPPLHGWNYTVTFHSLYPRLAAKYGVPLVPFVLTGVALVPEMNGGDGIHPNAAGAQRIAETVWPYLEPLLQTRAAA
jgi:acyl-CoA thioesterase-1